MAFRAVHATTYNSVRSTAATLKALAQSSRDLMAASTVSANVIGQLFDAFVAAKAQLQAASGVTGLAAYAKAQEGDQAYDVAAEFTAMMNACDAVINWITVNIPAANGYVQLEQWSASGRTVRQFTTAQTASLRTQLDGFIATVA